MVVSVDRVGKIEAEEAIAEQTFRCIFSHWHWKYSYIKPN